MLKGNLRGKQTVFKIMPKNSWLFSCHEHLGALMGTRDCRRDTKKQKTKLCVIYWFLLNALLDEQLRTETDMDSEASSSSPMKIFPYKNVAQM